MVMMDMVIMAMAVFWILVLAAVAVGLEGLFGRAERVGRLYAALVRLSSQHIKIMISCQKQREKLVFRCVRRL